MFWIRGKVVVSLFYVRLKKLTHFPLSQHKLSVTLKRKSAKVHALNSFARSAFVGILLLQSLLLKAQCCVPLFNESDWRHYRLLLDVDYGVFV